jgi:hypothetical protein
MKFHLPSICTGASFISIVIAILHLIGVIDLNKLRTDIYNCQPILQDVKEIVETLEK